MTALPELIENKKNQLTERLSAMYARDAIAMEEYERLVEYAQRIETVRELEILESLIAKNEGYSDREDDDDAEEYGDSGANSFAILSTRKCDGSIVKRGSGRIVSVLGSHYITLDEEDFFRGKIVLDLFALMGEITIYIPKSVRVINRATPIMGEVKTPSKSRGMEAGIGGTLILRGAAFMATIRVKSGDDSALKKFGEAFREKHKRP